jgi:hypothetical protein
MSFVANWHRNHGYVSVSMRANHSPTFPLATFTGKYASGIQKKYVRLYLGTAPSVLFFKAATVSRTEEEGEKRGNPI